MRQWMRCVCGSLLVVSGSASVWAKDATVIYRKSDRLVVGWVVPPQSVDVELQNLTHSDLGGAVSDYATVVAPEKASQEQYVIAPDLSVTTQDMPSNAQHKKDHASALGKLKALGLTEAEIGSLQ